MTWMIFPFAAILFAPLGTDQPSASAPETTSMISLVMAA
jgi:hypothetical protein